MTDDTNAALAQLLTAARDYVRACGRPTASDHDDHAAYRALYEAVQRADAAGSRADYLTRAACNGLGDELDALERRRTREVESLAHDHAKAVAERDEATRVNALRSRLLLESLRKPSLPYCSHCHQPVIE